MSSPDDPLAPIRAALEDQFRGKKSGDEIAVEKLQRLLRAYARHEIVWALKEMEEEGVGRFIAGRRGQPSRFLIGHGAMSVNHAASAAGEVPIDKEHQHVFVFRTSPPTVLKLPLDLTRVEADRIMRWVQTLPED